LRESVTGPLTGTALKTIPSRLTTWKRWRKLHPDTLVLSKDTGYYRDYTRDPYAGYHRSPFSFFGRSIKSPYLPEKELVLGIEVGGVKKAYPFSVLKKSTIPLKDTVAGRAVIIHFHKGSEEAYAEDARGERIPGFVSYWFVWYSFHPDTLIFKER